MKTFKKLIVIGIVLALWLNSVDAQNKLYGVTKFGGNGFGVLFEFQPASGQITKYYALPDTFSYPKTTLTIIGNDLYGMTTGTGAIIKWNLASNSMTVVQRYNYEVGCTPGEALSLYNGKYYGLTVAGGLYNQGAIIEWDPVSNSITRKVSFNPRYNGSKAWGHLTLWNNKFYGMTSHGGNADVGCIFEWNPVSGTITKKISFSDSDGELPYGSLVWFNGKFYGVTGWGGDYTRGVIFAWDPVSNIYEVKYHFRFNDNGYRPIGNLTLYNNKLYGVAFYGGINEKGVIFEWNPTTDTYTKKVDLGSKNIKNPSSSLLIYNHKFYGLSYFGGTYDKGTIYEWVPSNNNLNVVYNFDSIHGANPETANLVAQNWAIIEKPSGIDPNSTEVEANEPQIYFVNQNINIVNNWDKSAKVTVYDISGREVASYLANQGSNNFSFGLQKGVYIIKMANENQSYKTKIINM